MPNKLAHELAGGSVPETNNIVPATRHNGFAVRQEGDGVNGSGMPQETTGFLAAVGFPQPSCLIQAAGQGCGELIEQARNRARRPGPALEGCTQVVRQP